MKSKFYRLYVNGKRQDVLINANNIVDALHLAANVSDDTDETVDYVKVTYVDEKAITLDEVRTCDIISFSEG